VINEPEYVFFSSLLMTLSLEITAPLQNVELVGDTREGGEAY
jgi:hypothetical protein